MEKIKAFRSKKNDVIKVHQSGNYYVMKHYSDKKRMTKEYEVLEHLAISRITSPNIYKTDETSIYMDYIEGKLLLDYFIELEHKNAKNYKDFLEQLAEYHKKIYSGLHKLNEKMILKDMNFRNYIISVDDICRIDFEECESGERASDIGKLAAFALTYDPAYTSWKKTFSDALVHIFSEILLISKEQIIDEMNRELECIKIRRK